jgi:membrane protein CcdC involved in cytochrome C biogenesis
MMKRSSAFFAVIIVLAVVRYLARGFFDRFLTLEQTGALFYLLAFGMILRWRAKLFFAWRTLTSSSAPTSAPNPEEVPAND